MTWSVGDHWPIAALPAGIKRGQHGAPIGSHSPLGGLASARFARSSTIRYLASTLIVGLFFGLVVVLQGHGRPECFFLLLPAIFLSAILFEHGSGVYAALLSTVLLYWLVLPPDAVVVSMQFLPALAIFLVAALGLAILSERLQHALDRASAAEQIKDLLLRELNHRTKNNLAIVVSMLSIERLRAKVERRARPSNK